MADTRQWYVASPAATVPSWNVLPDSSTAISPAVAGSKPSEAMAVCTAASTLPDEKSAYFTRMFTEPPASDVNCHDPLSSRVASAADRLDTLPYMRRAWASLTSSGSLMRSRLPLSSPERAPLSAMDQPDSANAALTSSASRPTSEARFGRLAMEAGRARFCSTVARVRSAECVTLSMTLNRKTPPMTAAAKTNAAMASIWGRGASSGRVSELPSR